jgi:hypothetical protein
MNKALRTSGAERVTVVDLNDFETMSGYHSIAEYSVSGTVIAVCLYAAGICYLVLVIMIAATRHAVRTKTITQASMGRRRWRIIGILAVGTALFASLPLALTASSRGIWWVLLWEAVGAVVVSCVLVLAGALALYAEFADSRSTDDGARNGRRRINPSTGYPIRHGTVDVGGYSYGCGPDSP